MTDVLRLTILDEDHFIVQGDRPYRVEVSVAEGHVIMHAYAGAGIDIGQEPDLVYDGTEPGMHNMEKVLT